MPIIPSPPNKIVRGEIVELEVAGLDPTKIYTFKWTAGGHSFGQDAPGVSWNTASLQPGPVVVTVTYDEMDPATKQPHGAPKSEAYNFTIFDNVTQVASPDLANIVQRLRQPSVVALDPTTNTPQTSDLVLWSVLRQRIVSLNFETYRNAIENLINNGGFQGTDAYDRLRDETDHHMVNSVAAPLDVARIVNIVQNDPQSQLRNLPANDIDTHVRNYFRQLPGLPPAVTTPYLSGRGAEAGWGQVVRDRFAGSVFLELIWSYWLEEGMLVQTLNNISLRFQNIRPVGGRDPLANFDIDPLRRVSNLLWGYINDEQHRITVKRRAYEYEHHYGFTLVGKAAGNMRPSDSRTKFLEAFHNLLHNCTAFFKEVDDATIRADAFSLLNDLREVHILLAEGAHNQYGDLAWAARRDMMVQQYLLAQPEMQQFLGGRLMVPYQEPWMGRVDTMKKLQGWSNTSITHFYNLAVAGEQILLSVRHGNWNNINNANQAANWAQYWRHEIQSYIHAYRAVTGVDLSGEVSDVQDAGRRNFPPSVHLRNRLTAQLQTA